MTAVLLLTFPFFAVCLLGWIAARSGMLSDGAVRSLNVFVFNFAMPALIIGAISRADFAQLLNWQMALGWLAAGLVVFAVGALAARLILGSASTGAQWAIAGQAAAVGNIGFLALPLTYGAFGEAAVGPIIIALVVDLVILIPLSIAVLEGTGSVRRMIKGVALNPFILSIFAGLALAFSGVGLPAALDSLAQFLGAAASPAALFALGASLAGRSAGDGLPLVASLSVLKLLVHPGLVFVLLHPLLGVPIPATAIAVSIAAMPVAGNVFVIAERYGVLVRDMSAAVLISTVVCVATVSMMLAWALGVAGLT
ncbi:MAG: AEC family transporter [Pseudomonadota bacterium]